MALVIAAFFGGFFVSNNVRKRAAQEAVRKIKTGTLRIYSVPNKVSVYIDEDKQKQKTPHSFKLKPGLYKILLKSSQYFNWTAEIKVTKGQAGFIKAVLVKKPPKEVRKKTAEKSVESGIVQADRMMSQFMYFRIERNWKMARKYLTAKANDLYSNELLGGLSSPSYSHYEVLDEKRISDNEIDFNVRIFESMQGKEVHHFDEIIKTTKVGNDYLVYEITR